MKRIAAIAILLLAMLGLSAGFTATTPAAHASTTYVGARILDRAETKVNDGYAWGGTGPSSFDCSGLVYWAARSAGEKNWPRDTFDIAAQIGHRFVITSRPVRGDLAMWGSRWAPYHVEIVTSVKGWNFGAENPGWAGRVTWHSDTWFKPSFYLHILY
jgi:cell wall-associated NlpC family hydrolase